MVKGMGTQFDPEYAKNLIHMIDLDIEYTMREHEALENGFLENRIHCESIGHECTGGILLSNKMTRIRFCCLTDGRGFAVNPHRLPDNGTRRYGRYPSQIRGGEVPGGCDPGFCADPLRGNPCEAWPE